MRNLSYIYKIIIVLMLFAIFAIGMFVYGYGILETRNQVLASAATERRSEYELLLKEQKSFEQGKKDLAMMQNKTYPPEELFSKDTKVVKEIKTLEDIAATFGVRFSLAISGSTKTALTVAGTTSEVYAIPYSATLEGSFDGITKYLQAIEHLQFVTHTTGFAMTAKESGQISALLNSEFYIQK